MANRTSNKIVELPDGAKYWYLNRKYHRVDGPAVELPNGTKLWYLNGQCYGEGELSDKQYLKFIKAAKEFRK